MSLSDLPEGAEPELRDLRIAASWLEREAKEKEQEFKVVQRRARIAAEEYERALRERTQPSLFEKDT